MAQGQSYQKMFNEVERKQQAVKETQIDEKDQLFSLKFGLSEKHTKFEKIFLVVLTNQLINLVNIKTMRKIFSNYVCFSKSPNFTKGSLTS